MCAWPLALQLALQLPSLVRKATNNTASLHCFCAAWCACCMAGSNNTSYSIFALTGLKLCSRKPWFLLLKAELLAQAVPALEALLTHKFRPVPKGKLARFSAPLRQPDNALADRPASQSVGRPVSQSASTTSTRRASASLLEDASICSGFFSSMLDSFTPRASRASRTAMARCLDSSALTSAEPVASW